MQAIVFANGDLTAKEMAVAVAGESDLIIAADGGLIHCLALNIIPHVLIGDFDSTSPEMIKQFAEKGTEIISHPKDKDKTDLELALDLSVYRGVKKTYLFAALGNRWDMSLANLLLPAAQAYTDMRVTVVAERTMIYLLRAGAEKEISHVNGRVVSLLPVQADIKVTVKGFKYPLAGERIGFSSTRGISNLLSEDRGVIVVEEGILLCVQSQETD